MPSLDRPVSRRIAAALLSFLAILVACATAPPAAVESPAAVPAPAAESGFTILQINDTYKIEGLKAGREGGLARVRALRKELEAEGREVVILHAGDFLFPSVMSKYLLGVPMIDALDLLDGSPDFDDRLFVTFGNHEFDNSNPQVLFDRIAQSKFRWLSSNIRVRLSENGELRPVAGSFPNVLDHAVIDIGGIRLGIFGLTLDYQRRTWIEYGFAPDERRATVARAIDDLEREGAEYVVGLTHQDIEDDEWLARELGGRIDWIVGGHEHVYLRRQVGETGITKADADAQSAIRIDVRRDGRKIVATAERISLDATQPVDPDMAREVAISLVRLERAVTEKTGRRVLDVVATTEHLLEGTEPAIRGRETALGDFLCDTLRARFDAEIALVNGGAIRVNDDVAAGDNVRVYELEGIFYYDDKPLVIEITGRELLALLVRSVSEADLAHGRFLQVSGVRFRYRTSADGPPTVDAADVTVAREGAGAGFAPLELDRAYRVATMDYLWRFGSRDGYEIFGLGDGGTSPRVLETSEVSWRTLTEEAIAALPGRRIVTDVDGRIERIEGD